MNIITLIDRNRLLTDTEPFSDLMMSCISGPPLRPWNATKYVVSWLKSGRHIGYGALGKATGVCRKTEEATTSTLLFA